MVPTGMVRVECTKGSCGEPIAFVGVHPPNGHTYIWKFHPKNALAIGVVFEDVNGLKVQNIVPPDVVAMLGLILHKLHHSGD